MGTATIVGAGIGGLAAAVALRRAGWDVQVVEQAKSPRELGFALALAPNALLALRELGVEDAVARDGVAVKTFEFRCADGRLLKRVEFPADETQSLVTLRPALHGTLLAAVGIERVVLGRRVDSAEDLEGDVIIGADGVGSGIRHALHPDEPPPRPSGYHALRGVTYDASWCLGPAEAVVYLGDGVEIGIARASASAVYWYVSLVDALAAHSPVALLDRCTRGLEPRAAAIARSARPEDMRLDQLFIRDPIRPWGRGRVTLLGDAAHPVLPHTAQGAALALEDAVALGLAIRAEDVEGSLRSYETVRSRRTRNVVRAGPRFASLTTTTSRLRILLRNGAIRLTPARLLSLSLQMHARDPHRALRSQTR
ncbi:MAG TPA: FAD-dependent monooxygenase [Vicinamibacterales bacterium]